MDYAFSYTAKTLRGTPVSGVIFSEDADDAFFQVDAVLKLAPVDIRFNLYHTITGFFQRKPSPRDLIRFYRTVAERIRRAQSIPQGLNDAMEYIANKRFVSSMAVMRQLMFDGTNFADAMEKAGFPDTHVQALRSVQNAGAEAEILDRLAEQLTMNEEIKRKIATIIWYPVTVALMSWIVAWWVLIFVAPKLAIFFKKVSALDLSLPEWARRYYAFAEWFGNHVVIGTAIWIAIPAGVYFFSRSRIFFAMLDRVPTFYQLSMKADLITIWSSISLLFMSGSKPVEIFSSLAASARRRDNAERLEEMASVYRSGSQSIGKAVAQCNFPKYVQVEINAAESANNLEGGFKNLIAMLREDVLRHIEETQRIATLISYSVIAMLLMGFFFVTLYPQIAATMSKL